MIKMRFFCYQRLIVGVLVLFLILGGCTSQGIKSTEKNSFNEVTSKLDQGGEIYVYLSTEKVIRSVETFLTKIKTLVQKNILSSMPDKKDELKIFDFRDESEVDENGGWKGDEE